MDNCCCPPEQTSGCTICGLPLIYSDAPREHICAICGKPFVSAVCCEAGHYVCDACHSSGTAMALPLLLQNTQNDPLALFEKVIDLSSVHMHGPEHHALVPCVLLSAAHVAGMDFDLPTALQEALRRSKAVPGGTCGYWGVCGAAVGAGIFLSIVLKSNPMNTAVWSEPQELVSRCLHTIAQVGGPRCCKRTSRLAIETTEAYLREKMDISLPCGTIKCRHSAHNRECLGIRCKYFKAAAPPIVSVRKGYYCCGKWREA